MPFHSERYPKDWPVISRRIRERSGGCCECVGECGLHADHRCEERNHHPAKWAKGRIVLTVAHRNHDPQDCREDNLMALCQRCHLRYDQPLHLAHSRRTRKAKKAHAELF